MLEIWKFEKTCIFPKGIADGFDQKFEISSPCLSWLKLIKKIIVDILNRKIKSGESVVLVKNFLALTFFRKIDKK